MNAHSRFFSTFAYWKMFQEAMTFAGAPGAELQGEGADHSRLLGLFGGINEDLLTPDELKGLATRDEQEFNAWLAREGFPGLAMQAPPPPGFLAGGIFRVKVAWALEGRKTKVFLAKDGAEVDAFLLTEGISVRDDARGAIWTLDSKDERTRVTLAMIAAPSESTFALLDAANEVVARRANGHPSSIDSLTVPCVDFDTGVIPVEWITGIQFQAPSDGFVLAEAREQARVKMNYQGAIAEHAVAGVVRATAFRPERHDVIDRPFLVIFERDGTILCAAWIESDSMRDPGELELE